MITATIDLDAHYPKNRPFVPKKAKWYDPDRQISCTDPHSEGDQKVTATNTPKTPPLTVSHVFGEITWLLSESVQHQSLHVADLSWLVMPFILNRQFLIFRDGERPIGVALWAYLDEPREKMLVEGISNANTELRLDDCNCGDRLWLTELVAPFSTNENRQAELMVADLIAGPFADRKFTMVHTDTTSGRRNPIKVDADARKRLVENTKVGLYKLGAAE